MTARGDGMTAWRLLGVNVGMGGLIAGIEAAWRGRLATIALVESEPHARGVLTRYWPQRMLLSRVGDFGVRQVQGLMNLGGVEAIAASFSPLLRVEWDTLRDLVRRVEPRMVVLELADGLRSIDGGAWFGGVVGDLVDLGFDVQWSALSASTLGLPLAWRRQYVVAVKPGAGKAPVRPGPALRLPGARPTWSQLAAENERRFAPRNALGEEKHREPHHVERLRELARTPPARIAALVGLWTLGRVFGPDEVRGLAGLHSRLGDAALELVAHASRAPSLGTGAFRDGGRWDAPTRALFPEEVPSRVWRWPQAGTVRGTHALATPHMTRGRAPWPALTRSDARPVRLYTAKELTAPGFEREPGTLYVVSDVEPEDGTPTILHAASANVDDNDGAPWFLRVRWIEGVMGWPEGFSSPDEPEVAERVPKRAKAETQPKGKATKTPKPSTRTPRIAAKRAPRAQAASKPRPARSRAAKAR